MIADINTEQGQAVVNEMSTLGDVARRWTVLAKGTLLVLDWTQKGVYSAYTHDFLKAVNLGCRIVIDIVGHISR